MQQSHVGDTANKSMITFLIQTPAYSVASVRCQSLTPFTHSLGFLKPGFGVIHTRTCMIVNVMEHRATFVSSQPSQGWSYCHQTWKTPK